jgi:hypothetical protein
LLIQLNRFGTHLNFFIALFWDVFLFGHNWLLNFQGQGITRVFAYRLYFDGITKANEAD